MVWLGSLTRRKRRCFRLACTGLKAGRILTRFGAALLGLSLMMNAHADSGQSSGRSGDGKPQLETGISRFMFDGWAGPELRVWTYVPRSAPADAPILFVMHGVERDAKRYIEDWTRTAERFGVILIAPEFDERRFPGPGSYNQGGVVDPGTGKAKNPEMWTFSVIEPLFEEVKRRAGSRVRTYSVYGHSAGAQFVHRFVMLGHPAHLDRAVAANAGWYTWFDSDLRFPQGMKLTKRGDGIDRSGLAQRLTILLGTEDTESDDRNLRDDAWTRGQGQNRLERGRAFFAHAQETAGSGSTIFNWQLKYAPGVAHENHKMSVYAANVLFRGNDSQAFPQLLLALSTGEQRSDCGRAGALPRRPLGLPGAGCGAAAGFKVDVWAAQTGSIEETGSALLLDQPVDLKDERKLAQSLAPSVRIAVVDAAGKDPGESSRLEQKVDSVVERGANLVVLLNSPSDGRIRKKDRYTLFHLPRQKQGRGDREAGCAACGQAVWLSFAPDPAKRAIRMQVYPSAPEGPRDAAPDKLAGSSQLRMYVEAVRRISARTRDKVRFDAGQDELGDYIAFDIAWPRRE